MAAPSIVSSGTTQAQLDDLVLAAFPEQGSWEEGDYLWLTDRTNRLIEFTDGSIEVLPMPTDDHQLFSQYLFLAFLAAIQKQGGIIQYAPLRLQIRARKYREPDLMLLLDASDRRRGKQYWDGADLVIEIVSPDNPARDLVEKRRDYAKAQVPEYWIVNPRDETITVLRLQERAYVEHGAFARGDSATSALLTGFAVDVAALFDAD